MATFVLRPAAAADGSDILRRIEELAKYEYMEEQVILTEKGNASVVGRAGNERPVPATLMAADIVPRCPFLQIC